jgi:hypothetical protein
MIVRSAINPSLTTIYFATERDSAVLGGQSDIRRGLIKTFLKIKVRAPGAKMELFSADF